MLAGAARVTRGTQSQAKEAGAAFLLRTRVECISVFLAFEVLQRLYVCSRSIARRPCPNHHHLDCLSAPSQLQTAHTLQQRGLEWEGRKSQQLALWLRLDSQGSRSPHSHVSKQQGAHK